MRLFIGKFVLADPDSPSVKSRIISPQDLPLTFDLTQVWGQQTFDSPTQVWRATSHYTLKVYHTCTVREKR